MRWVCRVVTYEHWMVGIIDEPIENALTWRALPPVRWMAPFDRQRYFADPFPWPGSPDTLLCEEYDNVSRLGRLVAVKLDANGIAVKIPVDLPVRGHLSFPFLFMDEGVVYLMPESSASKCLEIFRWDQQNGLWLSRAVVFDQRSVADATLFKKDGLFWISYTDITHNPHDNLHLLYATTLSGPWLRHPGNPVRRGLESSRNGGGVFKIDGRLYRPTQDCSHVYGGALRLMEITRWTTTAYEEKEVVRLPPSTRSYPDGVHTLVGWGDKCLVDGMRVTFSLRLVWNKLKRRLGLRA